MTLRFKLNENNKIKAINNWAVAIMRYGTGVLDRKTRKLLTLHKRLHSKSDVNRLYVSRKEGRRGLVICEIQVEVEKIILDGTLRIRMKVCFKE